MKKSHVVYYSIFTLCLIALCLSGCSTISSMRPINSIRTILHTSLESSGYIGSEEFERTLDIYTNSKTVQGNSLQVLNNGYTFFPKLLEELDNAKESINIAMYDFTLDKIGTQVYEKLISAVNRGVKVRLTYDEFGCDSKIEEFHELQEAGGEVLTFNTTRFWTALRLNSRNHRKIVLIDGTSAFVSGLNISDNYNSDGFNGWRDSGVFIKGPVCNDIEKVFAQTWNQAGTEWFGMNLPIVGSVEVKRALDYPFMKLFHTEYEPQIKNIKECGDVNIRIVEQSPEWIDSYHVNLFTIAINSAKKSVYISTPYFLPSDLIKRALINASKRGVDVRILTQGKTDLPLFRTIARGEYHDYTEYGARIFEWDNSILHHKCAIIDGKYVIGGSVNLDSRSLLMNYEIAFCTDTEEVVQKYLNIYLEDLLISTEYTHEDALNMRTGKTLLFSPIRGQL